MRKTTSFQALLLTVSLLALNATVAEDKTTTIQQQLNAQTLQKPFNTANPGDLQGYLDDAVKKGIKPPMQPGPHWRNGYTCTNLSPYYYEYRDCMLYYRYYGCYFCQ